MNEDELNGLKTGVALAVSLGAVIAAGVIAKFPDEVKGAAGAALAFIGGVLMKDSLT
jgi:hypothetical protein